MQAQVAHKHAERRMVVAECCGRLAPLVAADMRPSLILSMLQQLAADADAGVQKSVAASLALLLPHLADLSKYSAVSHLPALICPASCAPTGSPALLSWHQQSQTLCVVLWGFRKRPGMLILQVMVQIWWRGRI